MFSLLLFAAPLGHVSNFKVTSYTSTSIDVEWSPVVGATEYKLSWNAGNIFSHFFPLLQFKNGDFLCIHRPIKWSVPWLPGSLRIYSELCKWFKILSRAYRWWQTSVSLPWPQCSLPSDRRPEPTYHLHHHHLCSVWQHWGTRNLLISAHRYRTEVMWPAHLYFNLRSKWQWAAVYPIVIKWVGRAKSSIPVSRHPCIGFVWLTSDYCGLPILTSVPVVVTCTVCHRVQVSIAAIVLSLSLSSLSKFATPGFQCQVCYTDK